MTKPLARLLTPAHMAMIPHLREHCLALQRHAANDPASTNFLRTRQRVARSLIEAAQLPITGATGKVANHLLRIFAALPNDLPITPAVVQAALLTGSKERMAEVQERRRDKAAVALIKSIATSKEPPKRKPKPQRDIAEMDANLTAQRALPIGVELCLQPLPEVEPAEPLPPPTHIRLF